MRLLLQYSIPLILFYGVLAQSLRSQTFYRQYDSFWAETQWSFVFKKNGEYNRLSSGFYGNTLVTGKYKVKNDTICILTADNDPHKTIASKYLLRNDSIMVDLNRYLFYNRIPTYKTPKKVVICMTGVAQWKPDSIYINHPELLPRLNENLYNERYCGKYERYILGDTAKAMIVDFKKGQERDKSNIIYSDTHLLGRSGTPSIYILTDSSGDFFIALDCDFEDNLMIGDEVVITSTFCYDAEGITKTAFDDDTRIKFMVIANVAKNPNKN